MLLRSLGFQKFLMLPRFLSFHKCLSGARESSVFLGCRRPSGHEFQVHRRFGLFLNSEILFDFNEGSSSV